MKERVLAVFKALPRIARRAQAGLKMMVLVWGLMPMTLVVLGFVTVNVHRAAAGAFFLLPFVLGFWDAGKKTA
jgi:hypothetical protein